MLITALIAFVLPLSLSPSLATQAQARKTLHYQFPGEPASLDPQVANFANDVAMVNALYRSLLRYDQNNNPAPSIAMQVPSVANGGISADGKTYTYKLRQDWKWSDGNGVVKAQDFVYTFQRLVNPKTAGGYGSFLDGLLLNADTINNTDPTKVDQTLLDTLGVKAVDDFTVQFTLVHAASYFNQIACLWFGGVVRKDNVERAGDPSTGAWADPGNGPVVGSGPFVLSQWEHNKQLVLTKNQYFAGSPAKLDEIDIPLIQDPAVAFVGFKSHQLDIEYAFPTAELNNVKADPVLGKALVQYPNSCAYYLGMDNTQPPFDNPDVRKAFAYALDRDSYNKVIAQGLATKWLSFLPPAIAGADPKLGAAYDFNADQAKAELAKAGYPNGSGFPTVSFHFSAGTNNQRRADWLQGQFKKILNVTISEDPMDSAAYQAALSNSTVKQDGLYYLGWCADYLHPSDWLLPVFGSNGAAGNANDSSGFHDANFEKLATQADQTLDPAAALNLYQQAQQILVDDVPVVFMNVQINALLVSPRVSNLPQSGLDGGFAGSEFWEDVDVQSS